MQIANLDPQIWIHLEIEEDFVDYARNTEMECYESAKNEVSEMKNDDDDAFQTVPIWCTEICKIY